MGLKLYCMHFFPGNKTKKVLDSSFSLEALLPAHFEMSSSVSMPAHSGLNAYTKVVIKCQFKCLVVIMQHVNRVSCCTQSSLSSKFFTICINRKQC